MKNSLNISSKNYSISLIRLIATISIVLCHFFQYYNHPFAWWFNVGVHIFLFISGFLYAGKPIPSAPSFVIKNFKKILVPYYCYLIPIIIIYFLWGREYISSKIILKSLLCIGSIEGLEHFWFIRYILTCYLITPFLYYYTKNDNSHNIGVFIIKSILFVLIFQLFGALLKSLFFFIISCYIIGYFFGILVRNYGFNTLKKCSIYIFGMCIIFICFKVCIIKIIPKTSFVFNCIHQYSHILLGISIFMIFYIWGNDIKQNKIFNISDKYSYYVYIVHQLFILGPFMFMTLTNYNIINWFIIIVLIMLSSFVLYHLSSTVTKLIDKFLIKFIKI